MNVPVLIIGESAIIKYYGAILSPAIDKGT